MANATLIDCLQPELVTVERVNYFPRQLLTADDMFADQEYFRLKLRRHNRFLHGWGTVCGLEVSSAATASQPWLVQIGGGYALGPYGDEIFVAEPAFLDLSQCGSAVTDPCEPDMLLGIGASAGVGSTIYIAIQYSECMARPVRVMPAGCGCEQTACENSRIRDSFQLQCLSALPTSYQLPPPSATLCDFIEGRYIPDCPPCPSDPWVVLAAVTLPASLGVLVNDSYIDNYTVRRQIFSTAILQDQIVECCCGPTPTPTPTPTPVPESADLAIDSSLTPSTDDAGAFHILLTATVTNNGPSSAKDVLVMATITNGQNVAMVFTGSDFPIVNGNVLQATIPLMLPGQTTSLKCTITPGPLTESTTFSCDATVSSSTFDPNLTNNEKTTQTSL